MLKNSFIAKQQARTRRFCHNFKNQSPENYEKQPSLILTSEY